MDHLYPVEKIFGENIFRIPDYQRGYAWEERQCREFLDDLDLLEGDRQHFMGTLILQEAQGDQRVTDIGGKSYTLQEVIDGQQRLTTIVLLMLAIYHKMELSELSELTTCLKLNFLVTDVDNRQPIPKLRLNQDSNDFFRTIILGLGSSIDAPKIASERRLLQAKTLFTNYLDEQEQYRGEGFTLWLKELYFKVKDDLRLLIYHVDSTTEAGIVFEAMNDRGKPITELEKVKNYLLILSGQIRLEDEHSLSQQVNKTWQHIYESLMAAGLGSRDNEDQLLRVHWLMTYDYNVRNWKRSQSIKLRFDRRKYRDNMSNLLLEIQDYLEGLRAACTAYCDILRPGYHNAFAGLRDNSGLRHKIQNVGQRLMRIRPTAPFLPLLTAVRLTASGEDLLRALELCELYAFRVYRLGNRRANTGQARLYMLGHNFYRTENFQELEKSLRSLIHRYSSDARFERSFGEEDNDWFHWYGLKYMLYEYEQHIADQRGLPVRMPWEELAKKKDTIEHILPQTMDRGGYWAQRFTAEEHKQWVHDIGNLTLSYDNSSLSNRPFDNTPSRGGKKEIYSESPLYIERAIARYDDWTIEAIRKRREEIKQWALKRWYVEKPPPEQKSPSGRQRFTLEKIAALAHEKEIAESYRKIVDTFARFGIGVRPWKYCITYTPPKKRQFALGAIWIESRRLSFGIWHGQFPRFFDITTEETKRILHPTSNIKITDDNVDEFIERLERLFEELNLVRKF